MDITKLQSHIAMNSPMALDWNKQRFLVDGETIEFSSCKRTYNNAEFTINDDVSRKIWYSQLAQPGFPSDFKSILFAGIKFLDGTVLVIEKMTVDQFVEKVRNKSFRVEEFAEANYTINRQSNTFNSFSNQSNPAVINYIIKCLENNKIEELGDLIKPSKLYNLIEVS